MELFCNANATSFKSPGNALLNFLPSKVVILTPIHLYDVIVNYVSLEMAHPISWHKDKIISVSHSYFCILVCINIAYHSFWFPC